MKKIAFLFLMAVSAGSIACEFDLDCDLGSKCIKEVGELDGICMGGRFPGNDNDRTPFVPDDKWSSEGETCSLDLDCEIGEKCAKPHSRLEGVCIKK